MSTSPDAAEVAPLPDDVATLKAASGRTSDGGHADHLPLYRQSQIYARQGIELGRSTLADWVGRAAADLRPLHERLFEHLKRSPGLFMDETRAPVLDPGRKRTKTGYLWALARDDRPGQVPTRPPSSISTRPDVAPSTPCGRWWSSRASSRWTAMPPTRPWPIPPAMAVR